MIGTVGRLMWGRKKGRIRTSNISIAISGLENINHHFLVLAKLQRLLSVVLAVPFSGGPV